MDLNNAFQIPKECLQSVRDIGRGAFGDVSLVYHREWKKYYAAKTIVLEKDPNYMQKFEQEAKKLMDCRHERIIDISGFVHHVDDKFPDQPIISIVTPYYALGNVRGFFERHRDTLLFAMKYRILHETAEGLQYLHSRSIIHMDIKAANVLLTDELHVKIIDFGLSLWYGSRNIQEDGRMLGGTPCYMPPEAFGSSGSAPNPSPKYDSYSYAIFMWELLSEERPYEDCRNNTLLQNQVQSGIRPDIEHLKRNRRDETYSKECCDKLCVLMQDCWLGESTNRPSFDEILDTLQPDLDSMNKKVMKELSSFVEKFKDETHVEEELLSQKQTTPFVEFMSEQAKQWNQRGHRQQNTSQGGGITFNINSMQGHVYFPNNGDDAEDDFEEDPDLESNDIHLRDKDEVISNAHLHSLSKNIGKSWKEFGRCLWFKEGELDVIEYNYHISGLQEVILQMLRQWKEANGKYAIREWIACACVFIGKRSLIEMLNKDD